MEKERHLTEEQRTRAVVDPADLPLAVQGHLSACGECHDAVTASEQYLERLSDTAERFVPVPAKRFNLPLNQPPGDIRWFPRWRTSMGWRTSLGMLATALLLIAVAWQSNRLPFATEDHFNDLLMAVEEVEALIAEVNILAENALPEIIMDISSEPAMDVHDAVMELIVPVIEDDLVSLNHLKKGVTSC